MIYKTFKDNKFEKESFNLAEKLAKMPTKAIGLTKGLLNLSLVNNLEDQLNKEAEYQNLAEATNDYKEGLISFLEKRKPEFKGN
jgi:2-(1,2-epoxy-1,2-dihydrophenyl)acetyl-CoA isomerase